MLDVTATAPVATAPPAANFRSASRLSIGGSGRILRKRALGAGGDHAVCGVRPDATHLGLSAPTATVARMRVCVTGAAGFIGSHLVDRLVADHEVVGIDDLTTGHVGNLEHLDGSVRLVEGSILDPDALDAAMTGVDAIVHLAARPSVPRSIADPVASHDANTTGTLRVLEAARARGDVHVVVASSSSVYGANPELPKHERLATRPMSPYAASKLATEQYALAWQASYGLPTLAFRFFNVFGPRQMPGHAYAAVVPAFIDAALRGDAVVVHGDGSQSRDFTYVGTVVDVIADAIDRSVSDPEPINLAYGTRTTLLELLDRLELLVGNPIERLHTESRPGDVAHSQADNTRLRSLFGSVEPVVLDDGLAGTIDWMRSHLERIADG
jgi:UDP-glucose 4-epimerase